MAVLSRAGDLRGKVTDEDEDFLPSSQFLIEVRLVERTIPELAGYGVLISDSFQSIAS